jgi:ComF family protein
LENFVFETGEPFDYLIPVPLFYYRENWRGFNQAEEIAVCVGGKMKVSMCKGLKRIKMTKQQALMKTKEDREKNIREAFVVANDWKGKLKGKKVLLVDDVFTSGTDMRECTKMLKKAGAKIVWGLALAH